MAFYWKACWRLITPVLLIAIVVEQFVNPAQVKYGDYVFPEEVQIAGWVLGCATTALIPLTAIWKVLDQCFNKKCASDLFQPTKDWGTRNS